MKLTMWLKERELNARRLAAGKTGDDRAGWLEDADHLQATRAAVEERDRLRAALGQYANPLNWSEDSAGIRRVWLEPDSTTPAHYNGFEAAHAALKA